MLCPHQVDVLDLNSTELYNRFIAEPPPITVLRMYCGRRPWIFR